MFVAWLIGMIMMMFMFGTSWGDINDSHLEWTFLLGESGECLTYYSGKTHIGSKLFCY